MRRGLSVWTRPEPDALVAWAGEHQVGELFVAVTADLASSGDLSRLRDVVRRAHAAGISVAALGGDSAWPDHPDHARAWLQAVLAADIFDGVHLDVEVWTRRDWEARRDAVVADYLRLLSSLRGQTRLRLEVDLAHSLHEVPAPDRSSLDAAVMRIADAVTVLSYRHEVTGPDSITSVARGSLAQAVGLGRPCRLAVETQDLGPDPVMRKQTFHGHGRAALARALDEVDSLHVDVGVYRGVAVHDYDWWRALGP